MHGSSKPSLALLCVMTFSFSIGADSVLPAELVPQVNNEALVKALSLQRGTARLLVPYQKQAAGNKAEDGPPTGPDSDVSPIYLVDKFALVSNSIEDDFDRYIPYSDELIRDHTSLNTYYFYPGGYLLKRDVNDGYDIAFLNRTRDDESTEDLIVLTFTLSPRRLEGALPLLETLADYAIKPLNDKAVELNRFPITSVKVNLGGLASLIPAENVQVINTPRRVGDDIRVQATMSESQKEDVVSSIRSGGMSGDIEFSTNDGSFMLIVPYYVSFENYSGDWVSDVKQLSTSDSLQNVSPFPLRVRGISAYVMTTNGRQIRRYFVPLAKPTVMSPGAIARSDRNYQQLFASYGEPISTWVEYERVTCEDCLNAIERDILVSPGMARRTELPIEAIPNVFGKFSLFKILVEVRSKYFAPSGEAEETRSFTLREDQTQKSVLLYIDRDGGGVPFEYRITPFQSEGATTSTSEWKSTNGLIDITVHAGLIGPLMAEGQ